MAKEGKAKAWDTEGGTKFRVLVGINWDDDRRRAEPGDLVDDLPPGMIKPWLRDGVIEIAEEA